MMVIARVYKSHAQSRTNRHIGYRISRNNGISDTVSLSAKIISDAYIRARRLIGTPIQRVESRASYRSDIARLADAVSCLELNDSGGSAFTKATGSFESSSITVIAWQKQLFNHCFL